MKRPLKVVGCQAPVFREKCSIAGCDQPVVMQRGGQTAESLKAEIELPLREHSPGNLLWSFCEEHYRQLPL
jgi:hypothetical protein